MNYAKIKKHDIANGTGVRVSLYVSGCTHHCRNCFNPETWDFSCGEPFTEAVEEEILEALQPSYIRGLTLLGGEPFEPQNRPALIVLAEKVRRKLPEKTIWCYTGYVYEKGLLAGRVGEEASVRALLELLDVLVDGEFEVEKKELDLHWKGSANQMVINVPETLGKGEIVLHEENC